MKQKKDEGCTAFTEDEAAQQPDHCQEADVSSKRIFGNHTLCAQFLRDYSGLELFANVQPEDIEDVSERYHLYREVELNSDTVKKVRVRNPGGSAEGGTQDIYVVSLIEHKSGVDYDVTMQILRYMVCIWENYVIELEEKYEAEKPGHGRTANGKAKRHKGISRLKGFRYPPIYPIVYYEGADEWTAAWHLKDRILLGDLFQAYIPDITYRLVRTREYSNEELLSREDAISLVMLLNKIQRAEDFRELAGVPGGRVDEIFQRAPADVVEIIISEIRSLCARVNMPQGETDELIKKVKGGNMGNLFENMEKMDIQLERRRTAEQTRRADEAEKRADESKRQADESKRQADNLYRVLITTYKKQGMAKEDVSKQLVEELGVDKKVIDEQMEKFWVE